MEQSNRVESKRKVPIKSHAFQINSWKWAPDRLAYTAIRKFGPCTVPYTLYSTRTCIEGPCHLFHGCSSQIVIHDVMYCTGKVVGSFMAIGFRAPPASTFSIPYTFPYSGIQYSTYTEAWRLGIKAWSIGDITFPDSVVRPKLHCKSNNFVLPYLRGKKHLFCL